MADKFITIKDAASILGVTPLTLRNWDKKGVLAAYRHPVNNYRLYRYADIENLLLELKRSRPNAAATEPAQKLPVRFEEDDAV